MTSFNNGLKVNIIKGASAEAITSATISCLSSKSTAIDKATEASASASTASAQASIATAQASIATTKANEASVSASASSLKANEASSSASSALTSKMDAATSEENALSYKDSASTSATIAITKANEALGYRDAALTYQHGAESAYGSTLGLVNNLVLPSVTHTVDTVDDFGTIPSGIDTVIVKDLNRGGTFVYDAAQSAVNNGGTVFNGWVRQYSGVVNVKWFGAVGDGITDDYQSCNSALIYLKSLITGNSGGALRFPKGVYNISETLDYYTELASGILIYGDGYGVTKLVWTGTSGALFSNEQIAPNKFQYGFTLRDMSLDCESHRVAGSVGIHAEMLQNKSNIRNVVISNFETGMFVGIHAEMLTVETSFIAYNTYGVYAQGDQSDVFTLRSVTFSYQLLTGLKLSSPRSLIDGCHFNQGVISDVTQYRDIQIGWSTIRAADIGKSSYAIAGRGNDGSRSRFINCSFEGVGEKSPILIKDFDTKAGVHGYDISFSNSRIALYDRPSFIEVVKPINGLSTSSSQMSFNTLGASLIDDPNIETGRYIIDEPNITKIWKTTDQFLRLGITKDYFENVPTYACSPQYSTDWQISKYGDGITAIDMGIDGGELMKISYDSSLLNGSDYIRFFNNACPAGNVYVKIPVYIMGCGGISLGVEANNGTSTKYFYCKQYSISEERKYIVFAFNNPSLQPININIFLSSDVLTDVNDIYMDRPLLKHFYNERESFTLYDERANKMFTNRNSQITQLIPKIPYIDILDVNNEGAGAWYVSEVKIVTIADASLSGSTTVTVAGAGSLINVGEYLHFKPAPVLGITKPYAGTITTGNKVVSISGDIVTLNMGIPFVISAGSTALVCEIYKKPNSTKL